MNRNSHQALNWMHDDIDPIRPRSANHRKIWRGWRGNRSLPARGDPSRIQPYDDALTLIREAAEEASPSGARLTFR